MELYNLINGTWSGSRGNSHQDVTNPATGESIARAPLSTVEDVDDAVQHASRAFPNWRATPVTERIQHLFRFKNLLEENLDDLARTISNECGKTFAEAAGELRRGIENVEVACGAPALMQGYNSEDIRAGLTNTCFASRWASWLR